LKDGLLFLVYRLENKSQRDTLPMVTDTRKQLLSTYFKAQLVTATVKISPLMATDDQEDS
jgi:hypothetical protein